MAGLGNKDVSAGIGATQNLRPYGIETKVDLPGVGENFHNHVLTGVIRECKHEVPAGKQNDSEAALFWKSDPRWPAPDLQLGFVHVPFNIIIGQGHPNSVSILPGYPQPTGPSAKMRIRERHVLCGGQMATAMCACASLGLRAKYVGVTGTDDNGRRIRAELQGRNVDITDLVIRDVENEPLGIRTLMISTSRDTEQPQVPRR